MGNRSDPTADLGRLGAPDYYQRVVFGIRIVFAMLLLAGLVEAAVTRSVQPLLWLSGGGVLGIIVSYQLNREWKQETLIRSHELEIHDKRGRVSTIPRSSVTSFEYDKKHDGETFIVACSVEGWQTTLAGSQNLTSFPPTWPLRRRQIEAKAKLEVWLRTGTYG